VTAESWPQEQEAVRVGIGGLGCKAVRLLMPNDTSEPAQVRDPKWNPDVGIDAAVEATPTARPG